jgi:hypothetical protein
MRPGFLGIDAWQISLDRNPGSDEELDALEDSESLSAWFGAGPSVHPLAGTCGSYSLPTLNERRCRLTVSAVVFSSVERTYRPGYDAVSDVARAW